jgi:hypothetical protein
MASAALLQATAAWARLAASAPLLFFAADARREAIRLTILELFVVFLTA